MTSSILDAVHETAHGLAKAGVMATVTLREFDALCLPPIRAYSADEIRAIRLRSKASQAVFAAIQKWEQGQKHPRGPSLKLLDLVDRKGLEALG